MNCMAILYFPKEKDGEVRSFFPKQRFLTVYFSFGIRTNVTLTPPIPPSLPLWGRGTGEAGG